MSLMVADIERLLSSVAHDYAQDFHSAISAAQITGCGDGYYYLCIAPATSLDVARATEEIRLHGVIKL